MPRGSRGRLWAFALGAAGCMLLLCLGHQAPGLLGPTDSTDTAIPQPTVPPATRPAPVVDAEPVSTVPPEAAAQPSAAPDGSVDEEPIRLTIVYDNRPADPRLRTAWGFACWIDLGETVVLFDTGGDGATLLENLAALGFDPDEIDIVVLSHAHDDHTGGLQALLDANDQLEVYLPGAFPEYLKARARERAVLVEVDGRLQITEGVWSLGPMGTSPVEQALAIETSQGLVVVTGCAHPGVAAVAGSAREMGRIHLVLGGFHLGDQSAVEIDSVIRQLQLLEVERVAPSHCTGDLAIGMFAEAFGQAYIEAGVGMALQIPR